MFKQWNFKRLEKKILCNRADATYRTGTVYPSGATEFTPDLRRDMFAPL
jgi:hypothetical protein